MINFYVNLEDMSISQSEVNTNEHDGEAQIFLPNAIRQDNDTTVNTKDISKSGKSRFIFGHIQHVDVSFLD